MSHDLVKNVQDTTIALMIELHKDPNFCKPEYINEFMALDSHDKKVDFMYNFLQKFDLVNFCKDEKNDAKAIQYRQQGNNAFYNQGYRLALSNYNLSVFNAKSSEVLALAYSNRSAVLYKLELFNDCLLDIERAIGHGYPEESKSKLLQRQQNATAKLAPFRYYENPPIIPADQINPQIQCATKSIRIEKGHPLYGNHVVATKDVDIGEVLLVEEVFAASFDGSKFQYCQECGCTGFALIPCKSCTKAFYCSNICRVAAYSKYHKYECPILATLVLFLEGMSPEKLLAIRMTLGLGNMCNEDLSKLKNGDGLYRSDRYNEVFNLQTNAHKILQTGYMTTTTIAAYVFDLVEQYTDFFKDNQAAKQNFKHLLNLNLLICDANVFDVSARTINPFCTKKYVGVGVYPFSSLFNHSCKVNVVRIFHGTTVVCRAVDFIKRGEQCFISYSGTDYLSLTKLKRQTILLQTAHFTCQCEACEEDWEDLSDVEDELICRPHRPNNGFQLMEAIMGFGNINVRTVKRFIRQLISKMNRGDCHERPCSGYLNCQELLIDLYQTLGNKDVRTLGWHAG